MNIEKRITQILHVHSDFDEHELHTEIYDSLENFILNRTCVAYTLNELKLVDFEDQDYGDEEYCYNLIKDGEHIGEWSTDELWFVIDGKLQKGLSEV